jgi:hypothetical protein
MKQITLSIEDDQWLDFKKYYLKRRPVPLEAEVPIMSDADWMKSCIAGDINQVLREGKQMEAFDALSIDVQIT